MREQRRVRSTGPRVPFPGEPGKYLPGVTKKVDPTTGQTTTVPGSALVVPWTAYWRSRESDGFIELADRSPAPVLGAARLEPNEGDDR
jgi:hypothetical protein